MIQAYTGMASAQIASVAAGACIGVGLMASRFLAGAPATSWPDARPMCPAPAASTLLHIASPRLCSPRTRPLCRTGG